MDRHLGENPPAFWDLNDALPDDFMRLILGEILSCQADSPFPGV
jgi:hypothetical protein